MHQPNVTLEFLHENNFKVVSYAPYSPDLAPSNFCVFPTMKNALGLNIHQVCCYRIGNFVVVKTGYKVAVVTNMEY